MAKELVIRRNKEKACTGARNVHMYAHEKGAEMVEMLENYYENV